MIYGDKCVGEGDGSVLLQFDNEGVLGVGKLWG